MKIIITESQYELLNEQLAKYIGKGIGKLFKSTPKVIKSITPEIKTLNSELYRVIPPQYLKNEKEVSLYISRLKSLNQDLNKINVDYIKKYGQKAYDDILINFILGGSNEKTFLNTLKNVKNPNIRLKPILGLGREHYVFESVLYPNKIIKVESSPGTINKWYSIFKSRPDIFPVMFKTLKVTGKEGEKLMGVVLERLDTSKFIKLWGEIESEMYPLFKNLPISEREVSLEGIVKYIKTPKVRKQWVELLNFTKKEKPNLTRSIDEFSKMVNELYKITPNPDIRKFNFGYDDKGVLKCLDI
jgi:hypothetical protein